MKKTALLLAFVGYFTAALVADCESRGRYSPGISKDHLAAEIGEFNCEGTLKSSVRLDREDCVNGLKADVLSGKKRTVESSRGIGACEKKTLESDFELVGVI